MGNLYRNKECSIAEAADYTTLHDSTTKRLYELNFE